MAQAEISPRAFFDLSKCKHYHLFDGVEIVWEALERIPSYISASLQTTYRPSNLATTNSLVDINENVHIGHGTIIESGVTIKSNVIIGANCEIRSGAYIRENVLVGDNVVIGHTTELKHCLLFDEAEVPHFNYVGDSILGWKAHLGAGVKISNFKITGEPVNVSINGEYYNTGLRKFGAIIGDKVDIGCNSVLNPGTMIGRNTLAYANLSLRGYYPSDLVIKLHQTQEIVNRRINDPN